MNVGNNERRLTAEFCALSEATIRNHVADSDCHVRRATYPPEGFDQGNPIKGLADRGVDSLRRVYRLLEMCVNCGCADGNKESA